jgi:hypothetical protein
MMIAGEYPKSRFFSFTTYYETGGAVSTIVDKNLAPNPGSINPFQPGPTSGSKDYTLTVDGNATGSGNHLQWANTKITYVVYRIYVADKGLARKAGVPLPAVTLVGANGDSYPITACASSSSEDQFAQDDASQAGDTSDSSNANSCPSNQPSPQVITFVVNTSHSGIFPNPATTYAGAKHLCLTSEKVIVVRGKGAVFPNTYNGSSIFQPAIPGQIQLRYWSICNNLEQLPLPVVDCKADHFTALEHDFYTYVFSAKESGATPTAPPLWVQSGVTWLAWGDPTVQHDLLFRDMLPMPGFALAGDYPPKGVYCDKELFIKRGWQGCFAAAGVTLQ